MKKHIVTVSALAAMAAGSAFAGLLPSAGVYGLPQNWTNTDTQGYTAQAAGSLDDNPASAMCVECHSVNPSQRIPNTTTLASGAANVGNIITWGGGNNTAADAFLGSHVVINSAAGLNSTNSGGGFIGGFGNAARDGDVLGATYFNKAAGGTWSASGGVSKFGTASSATVITGSILQSDAGFAASTANMICESCHSVYFNVLSGAGGTDNDLLLDAYVDNGADTICLNCHANNSPGTYAGFHANDNLAAFAGTTVRKRHHVMTADTLQAGSGTPYGATGTASIMWAPSASNKLDNSWCLTAYTKITPATELNLTTGAVINFRNACNVAGQGTRDQSVVTGAIDVPDAATVTCSNCHRPHNAQAASGAFILRYGRASYVASNDFPGKVPTTGGFNGMTNTDIRYGLRRQSDVGSYATKVYGDYLPLCIGCHVGYGN